MTPEEFRAIRISIGLNQRQLAEVLGYKRPMQINAMESTAASARPVPDTVAMLMRAFAAGYRPECWPVPAHRDAS